MKEMPTYPVQHPSGERSGTEPLARHLAAMVECSNDACIITDRTGRIMYANDAARRMGEHLAFSTEQGARLAILDPRRLDDETTERLTNTIDRGDRFNDRVRLLIDTDIALPVLSRGAVSRRRHRWIALHAFPLPGENGQDDHIAFMMRDIDEDVQREMRNRIRTEGAEARVKIGTILSSNAPLKERFERAVETVIEIEELAVQKKGGVFLLEPGDDRLRMFCHIGKFTHQFLEDEKEVMLGSCLCGRAALSGQIIISDNCFEDERHEHSWPNMAAHGHYIVPLMDQSECVGVLFLYTDVNPTRVDERLDALLQIGELMANAIVRERNMNQIAATAASLREMQTRFELAIEGSRDAIFDWSIEDGKVFYSSRWGELLGRKQGELEPTIDTLLAHISSSDIHRVETQLTAFIEGADSNFECEFRLMATDGRVVWALLRAAALRDGNGLALRISGSIADISTIKAVHEEMRRMVERDQLTGLASRSKLLERLEHTLVRNQRSGKHCAILFFDFDRFKVVNDSLGHEVGDELLCSIASRIRENVRDVDTVARFGGDEFVVLLEDLNDPSESKCLAQKLLDACAEPHVIRGHRLVSTASIGLVTSLMSNGASAMIRDADAAMYQAKANGRGQVVEFDTAMHEAMLERLALEDEMRSAIGDGQFVLHFQPIVNLETGIPISAESLVRWIHPNRGFISPAKFIPIAEESNQIHLLGEWVLREACRQLVEWRTRGAVRPGFTLCVNVSKAQLLMPGFVDQVETIVDAAGLTPRDMKLEVTETTIVDNRSDIADVLNDLRKRGFVVMMDDFGTGHSSLSGLHSLPIDELKIDQSFIRHNEANREIIAITSSIVALADHLALRTVGEGVESINHVAMLQDIGCHYGQGYFFSKPLPADEFETWYRSREIKGAA
ncbi:MAG: EAL domain-containing protein [Planctomycetota bacterium]|nr:MAG: EAL domain-containing protein [Planctomycetota bacterium]